MIRRQIGVVLVFIVLLSIFGLAGCKEAPKKGIERIESIIGVSLPSDAVVKYHYFDHSMDSSYTQYTLFELKSHPEDFLISYPLVQATKDWGHKDLLLTLKGRKISEEYIPNFNESFMSNQTKFTQGFTETLVFFPSTLQLAFYKLHVG